MSLVGILIVLLILAAIGFATWAIIAKVPMPRGIQIVIIVFAVIVCILIALYALNIDLNDIRVPRASEEHRLRIDAR